MLHLLVGPWASGKTTVAQRLAKALPECVVFDWDTIIPGLSSAAGTDVHTDPSTWDGLRETWMAIVEVVLAGGRSVVLCGPLRPVEIDGDRIPETNIQCAYLDCPDSVLSSRLEARGVDDGALGDELETAAALRGSGFRRIEAGDVDPEQIVAQVVAWVHD